MANFGYEEGSQLLSVGIGSPIRNRAWFLPQYLNSISQLDQSNIKVSYIFLINDCIDNTAEILEQWKAEQSNPITLLYYDFNYPGWLRDASKGKRYSFENLAKMRNMLFEEALKQGLDYFFSVDSDTLVEPHTLKALLSAKKDIISALTPVNPQETMFNVMWWNDLNQPTRAGGKIPEQGIFEVGATAGCCLYSRRLMEQCRFEATPWGEDIGLCNCAREKNFSVWCNASIKAKHVMEQY